MFSLINFIAYFLIKFLCNLNLAFQLLLILEQACVYFLESFLLRFNGFKISIKNLWLFFEKFYIVLHSKLIFACLLAVKYSTNKWIKYFWSVLLRYWATGYFIFTEKKSNFTLKLPNFFWFIEKYNLLECSLIR